MKGTARKVIGRLRDIVTGIGRSPERERARVLDTEKPALPPGGRGDAKDTNAEVATSVMVIGTVSQIVERARKKLLKLERELIDGATRAATARLHVQSLAEDGTRALRAGEHEERSARTLDDEFDRTLPTISRGFLLKCEIFFAVAEYAFWFAVFSREVNPADGWLSGARIQSIVLPILFPVVAIAVARLVGPLLQRHLRHPGETSRERRLQRVTTFAGLGLVGVACWAVYGLVAWRYGAAAPLGSMPLPADYVAAFFCTILVVDVLARTAATSEQHVQDQRRDAAVASDRATALAAEQACVMADSAWVKAWLALESELGLVLGQATRVTATGAGIILDSRAKDPAAPVTTPMLDSPEETSSTDGLRSGAARMPWLIDAARADVSLRLLDTTVATLQTYAPPTVTPDAAVATLADLHEALHAVAGTGASTPAAAPADIDLRGPSAVADVVEPTTASAADPTSDNDQGPADDERLSA